MKHKLFVIFLSLLSFGWSVAAQKTGTVYTVVGQVVDSLSNETVPYATLNFALSNAPQKSVLLVACDIDGKVLVDVNTP